MIADIPTLAELEALIRRVLREELANGGASDILNTEQAAEIAGVHPKTVQNWIVAGKLPAGHRGRRRTIKRSDLQKFLEGEVAPVTSRTSSEGIVASLLSTK